MIGVKDLFENSWKVFKSDWKKMISITAVSSIFSLLNEFVSVQRIKYLPENSWWSVFIFLGIVIFWGVDLWFTTWSYSAMIVAVKNSVEKKEYSWKSAFKEAKPYLNKMLAVVSLTVLMVFGAMLLLIIPALIVIVWMSFASTVVICEDLSGFDAIKRSRQLVKGSYWQIVGRYLLVGLVIMLIMLVVKPVRKITFLIMLINFVVNSFWGVFVGIYGYLMYRSLAGVDRSGVKQ